MCYHLISFFVDSAEHKGVKDAVVCKEQGNPLDVFELLRVFRREFKTYDIEIFGAKPMSENDILSIDEGSVIHI